MEPERIIEFILTQQAKTEGRLDRIEGALEKVTVDLEKLTAGLGRTDRYIRRAFQIGVREARAERRKRQQLQSEFDRKMTELAAAQLITEERLQGLIKSIERGRNGHS